MNQSIEERTRELWSDDSEAAIRIVQWFDLLVKVRQSVGIVPAEQLVEQLRRADPAALNAAHVWLVRFLFDRFQLERDVLDQRVKRRVAAKSKHCPYSAEQYDAAVARVGTKQEALAKELRVDRKTLTKYKRPA